MSSCGLLGLSPFLRLGDLFLGFLYGLLGVRGGEDTLYDSSFGPSVTVMAALERPSTSWPNDIAGDSVGDAVIPTSSSAVVSDSKLFNIINNLLC